LRDGARDGADEVLSHLPELGDRELQSALDAYLDQVADLLREVDDSASELADRLDIAAAGTGATAVAAASPAGSGAPHQVRP
jgi:hypothetical protein